MSVRTASASKMFNAEVVLAIRGPCRISQPHKGRCGRHRLFFSFPGTTVGLVGPTRWGEQHNCETELLPPLDLGEAMASNGRKVVEKSAR